MRSISKKDKCPRCGKRNYYVCGIDDWGSNDIVTYMACQECSLLYWYSSYLKEVATNGNDASPGFIHRTPNHI